MDDASGPLVRRALERVSAWAPDLSPDERYVPLADLDLDDLASAIGRRLGGAPLRMGRSAALMGIASRLWSVTVVPYVADGVLPDPTRLLARHDDGSLVLGVRSPSGWTGASVDDLDAVVRSVVEPAVAALPLARRLLWGNVAASLHAVPRVHALPQAAPVVERLLRGPGLAGELDPVTARRRTCCLFYLAPGAGLCGDCVLDHLPARRPMAGTNVRAESARTRADSTRGLT